MRLLIGGKKITDGSTRSKIKHGVISSASTRGHNNQHQGFYLGFNFKNRRSEEHTSELQSR